MLRSRRESPHRNGITDLNPLQRTSATKSARFGHGWSSAQCLLPGIEQKSDLEVAESVDDVINIIGPQPLMAARA
jgi:hypothetical protein